MTSRGMVGRVFGFVLLACLAAAPAAPTPKVDFASADALIKAIPEKLRPKSGQPWDAVAIRDADKWLSSNEVTGKTIRVQAIVSDAKVDDDGFEINFDVKPFTCLGWKFIGTGFGKADNDQVEAARRLHRGDSVTISGVLNRGAGISISDNKLWLDVGDLKKVEFPKSTPAKKNQK